MQHPDTARASPPARRRYKTEYTLQSTQICTDVHASVSHSGWFVAVAVAERPVGIDIEAIAAHAAGEWRLDEWVRVENVLKATGDGLSIDPRSVELMLGGDHRRVTAYGEGALDAVIVDLPTGAGAVGAVTVLGTGPLVLRRGDLRDLDVADDTRE